MMALTPAEGPAPRRKNQNMIEEVMASGVEGQWYLVAQYENHATARDSAHKLRERNPGMDIRAEAGSTYARRSG